MTNGYTEGSEEANLADLNALTSGQTPKKDADGGFSAADLDNVPDSSTRKAVTAAGATAANALGAASVTATIGTGVAVLANGATVTAVAKLGLRDTSAAYDTVIAATSSTPLSAERTLTLDLANGSKTLKLPGNAVVSGTNTGDQAVESMFFAGANLTNADATVNPGTDGASVYTMPAATQNAARVITLGVTGTLIAGVSTVWIVRRDATANTLTIRNGGTNGVAVPDVVIPASPTHPMAVGSTYDGADWVPHTVVFVQ
jgi:hypothetical protein